MNILYIFFMMNECYNAIGSTMDMNFGGSSTKWRILIISHLHGSTQIRVAFITAAAVRHVLIKFRISKEVGQHQSNTQQLY